jgi:concentrative nucleoside transporter, CNT family
MFLETEESSSDKGVRDVRDTESQNVIDAIARGALNGGRIAVIVGCLLIAFIALIAMANGLLSGVGEWFGYDGLTFQRVFDWIFSRSPGSSAFPGTKAARAGTYIGEKTVRAERRGDVAQLGLKALLAGSLVNLANASIAGVVAA